MPGTEEILRNACNKKNALDDAHLKPKENCVPWLLDVDFENDMVGPKYAMVPVQSGGPPQYIN